MRYVVTIAGHPVEVDLDGEHLTIGGRRFTASLQVIRGTPLRLLLVDGRPETLVVEPNGRGRWGLQVAGERWDVEVLDERTRHIRSLTSVNDQPRSIQVLKAPMPGLVVRVLARPGEPIAAGSGVVVLEAMKMENELTAAGSAVVKAVRVEPGQVVEKGQVLVEFES